MKWPFSLTIKGILLSGKDREKAKVNYELKGEDLERALLAIEYDTDDLKKLKEYRIKKLQIDKKYSKISDFDYDLELSKLNIDNKSDDDLKIEELDILLKYNKINNLDYCIKKNDILKKPWVAIKTNYDEDNDPDNLQIEVVHNKTFIERMRQKGLPGDTDEDVVEQWLKLFMVANLDTDDLSLLEDEIIEESLDEENVIKLENTNKTLIK